MRNRNSIRRFFALHIAFALLASTASGSTLYVDPVNGSNSWSGLCQTWDGGTCGPKRGIQAAINVAVHGDTIILADGTHTSTQPQFNFQGKRITIRGASGAATRILDMQGTSRGFIFTSGETPESVLDGVTIRNARAPSGQPIDGGAIRVANSSPTIRNCVIRECDLVTQFGDGGGMALINSAALIEDCVFEQNEAFSQGASMLILGGSPLVRRCLFRNNPTYSDSGGSLYAEGGTFRDCTFDRERDGNYFAAGTLVEDCTFSFDPEQPGLGIQSNGATIRRCAFVNCGNGVDGPGYLSDMTIECDGVAVRNPTEVRNCRLVGRGDHAPMGVIISSPGTRLFENCILENFGDGAVRTTAGTLRMTNCGIRWNLEYLGGGAGIYAGGDAAVTLDNCVLESNLPDQGGGGAIYCTGNASVDIDHSLLRGNNGEEAGAIFCNGGSVRVTNSILTENFGGIAREAYVVAPGTLEFRYCLIEGGTRFLSGSGGSLILGPGIIDGDPLLVPREARLTAGSPCVDAGDPAVAVPGEFDFDGEPRGANERRDIGPDEFTDADGDEIADVWEIAEFGALAACDPVADEDADGLSNLAEYEAHRDPHQRPTLRYIATSGDDAWDGLAPAFNGVSGPKRTLQAAVDDANPVEHDTIIVAPGTYTGSGNRDVQVEDKNITIQGTDPASDAVIAATIFNAEANVTGSHRILEMRHSGADQVWVKGLTLRSGYAPLTPLPGGASSRMGAAVQMVGGRLNLERCVVSFNGGGAVHGSIAGWGAQLNVASTRFTDNNAGGVYVAYGSATTVDSTFFRNWSRIVGYYTSSQTVRNCSFDFTGLNSIEGWVLGDATIEGCVFRNYSQAVDINNGSGDSTVIVRDCQFLAPGGQPIHLGRNRQILVENCLFDGVSLCDGALEIEQPAETVVRNCTFRSSGGSCSTSAAVNVFPSTATPGTTLIEQCEFIGSTGDRASDILANRLTTVVRCRFIGHRSANAPVVDGPARLVGCLFTGCSATPYLLRNTWPDPLVVESCTLGGNSTTSSQATVLLVGPGSSAIVRNSVAWFSPAFSTRPAFLVDAGASLSLSYNVIERGPAAVQVAGGGTLDWGLGNTEGDPRFVDLASGDLRVLPTSACIDAGDELLTDQPPTDLGGCPRIADNDRDGGPRINIGAYETGGFVVDDDGPADFATIQSALAAIVDDCASLVLVRNGAYAETVTAPSRSFAVVSESGPLTCRITGLGDGPVATLGGAAQTLRGFSIEGGAAEVGGGVLVSGGGDALVADCILSANAAERGAALAATDASATIRNSLIARNTSPAGGAIAFERAPRATLQNVTIAGNSASAAARGILAVDTPLDVSSSIVFGNDAPTGVPSILVSGASAGASVRYSCVQGGWSGSGSNNISTDPRYVDAALDNFRLGLGSPCIDRGDTAAVPAGFVFDLDGNARQIQEPLAPPNSAGTRPVDMGAFEAFCAGDLDGDFQINLADLTVLLSNFGVPGGANPEDGDVDRDGDVDLNDLSFVLSSFGYLCR